MRKILTSVLSVAGLLAVVLALASSPASAAKEVVTIQTDDPGQAGTYTLSWETQGGCDPGAGTSGASGSVTLTVTDSTPNDDTANTGPRQETGIVTEDICNYTYKATFTNAAGADCAVTGTGANGALAVADATNVLALTGGTGTACTTTANIYVTVKAPGDYRAVGTCYTITPAEASPFAGDDCDVDNADDDDDLTTGVDTGTRRLTADDVADAASRGAASATTFTVTATPEPPTPGGQVPEGCRGGSEDTETDHDDNNLQKAVVKVVNATRSGANCIYTVTATLPSGFVAGGGEARSTANQQKGVDPAVDATAGGPDGDTDTTADNDTPFARPDALEVSIATVKVYLVQNVIGDAGGASAEYKYTAPCGAPGLPGALKATPASGGISTVAGKTLVELRTGRFNISEALPDGTANDGTAATALNDKGRACEATVSVSGVPANCSVSSNSPASLATTEDSVIIEVTIDCTPPPTPEPPAPEPAAEAATGDMDGDDMSGDMDGDDMSGDMDDGDMDSGADDMAGDDMDDGAMGDMDDGAMGDMDDGAMGPPKDTATG